MMKCMVAKLSMKMEKGMFLSITAIFYNKHPFSNFILGEDKVTL